MIIDNSLIFGNQQQVIGDAIAADVVVEATDYIGWPEENAKALHPIKVPGIVNGYVKSIVTTAFVGAGATVSVGLFTSEDNVTYTELISTPPRTIAELTSMDEAANIPLPAGLKRYLKVKYTIKDAEITVGAISSFIALSPMPL